MKFTGVPCQLISQVIIAATSEMKNEYRKNHRGHLWNYAAYAVKVRCLKKQLFSIPFASTTYTNYSERLLFLYVKKKLFQVNHQTKAEK